MTERVDESLTLKEKSYDEVAAFAMHHPRRNERAKGNERRCTAHAGGFKLPEPQLHSIRNRTGQDDKEVSVKFGRIGEGVHSRPAVVDSRLSLKGYCPVNMKLSDYRQ